MKLTLTTVLAATIAVAHPIFEEALPHNQLDVPRGLNGVDVSLPTRSVNITVNTDKIPANLTPIIVKVGNVSDSELASIIASVPKPTPAAIPSTARNKKSLRNNDKSDSFQLSKPDSVVERRQSGPILWNYNGQVPQSTTVYGPFSAIAANLDTDNYFLAGISVVDVNGVQTNIGNTGSLNGGNFTFASGEVITSLTTTDYITSTGADVPSGFIFQTSAGHTYNAGNKNPQYPRTATADVGSGYLAQIVYSTNSANNIEWISYNFLAPITSTGITNFTYAGAGLTADGISFNSPTSVATAGTLTIDNRNSSVVQTETLQTIKTATTSVQYDFSDSWTAGGSVSIEVGAEVFGFGTKDTVTAEFSYQHTTVSFPSLLSYIT